MIIIIISLATVPFSLYLIMKMIHIVHVRSSYMSTCVVSYNMNHSYQSSYLVNHANSGLALLQFN